MTTDKLQERLIKLHQERQLIALRVISTWARHWEDAFESPKEALIAIVDKCHQVLEEDE